MKYAFQPLATGATAVFPYSKELEDLLVFTSKFEGEEPFSMAFREGDYLHCPRNLFPLGEEDWRVDGTPINIKLKIGPRDAEQERIIAESLALLQAGEDHVLQAGTGVGKTIMSLMIAAKLGKKTLVVVNKEDLLEQWEKAIHKTWGPHIKIGRIQGDKCHVGQSITIAMIHTLAGEKYNALIEDEFGLVIMDEGHHAPAHTFVKAARMFYARHRLTLTATPKRPDGKEEIAFAHLGEVRVVSAAANLVPRIIAWKSSWKVPLVSRKVDGEWVKIPVPHKMGQISSLLKYMCADSARNSEIVKFVVSAYHAGRHILVLSEVKETYHAHLKELLVQGGIPAEAIGFYTGGMSQKQLNLSKEKPVIIGTYGMVQEATDIPSLDTCVLTTPKSNIVQAIGRILRLHPTKKEPVVFDVMDTNSGSSVLTNYAKGRVKRYAELGATVKYYI